MFFTVYCFQMIDGINRYQWHHTIKASSEEDAKQKVLFMVNPRYSDPKYEITVSSKCNWTSCIEEAEKGSSLCSSHKESAMSMELPLF